MQTVYYINVRCEHAEVAELADAQASGACGSNTVWVQVPSPALFILKSRDALMIKHPGFFCIMKSYLRN